MALNNDLTIVLALKDRSVFTWRWFAYADKTNFPFHVIAADGGKDQTVSRFLADRTRYPRVDYEYIRYPYDETYSDFYAKVVDALSRVKTPFVVIADNDDFFVADGLVRSIEFLRNHPDYSSCRGIIGGVRVEPDAGYGERSSVYGKDVSFAAEIYPSGSTLDATAAQRAQNYFSYWRPNYYDVFRTEQSKANFQLQKDLDIKDLILAQHIFVLGNIAGKVHRDSYLYLVRQMNSPDSSSRAEILKKGDHFDRMLLETWSDDFTGFVIAIAAAISQKDGISIDEARRQVKQGWRTFMAPTIIDYLLAQTPLTKVSAPVRKLYGFVRTFINGQLFAPKYVPGQRFVASHNEFRTIYGFLATPPPKG